MQTLSEIEQASLSTVHEHEPESWGLELHPEGALLVGERAQRLLVGDSIILTVRLSTGARIQYCARVRGLASLGRTAETGAWIELTDLSIIERHEFRRWQELMTRERGTDRIPVEVECKVRFRRYAPTTSAWLGATPCH